MDRRIRGTSAPYLLETTSRACRGKKPAGVLVPRVVNSLYRIFFAEGTAISRTPRRKEGKLMTKKDRHLCRSFE
jgi:hypothetical protein